MNSPTQKTKWYFDKTPGEIVNARSNSPVFFKFLNVPDPDLNGKLLLLIDIRENIIKKDEILNYNCTLTFLAGAEYDDSDAYPRAVAIDVLLDESVSEYPYIEYDS